MGMSFRISSDKEALDLSDSVSRDSLKRGQHVQLEFDAWPRLITPFEKKDFAYFFVKDVSGHVYIASISAETMDSINTEFDIETKKLKSTYRLKGILYPIDEQVKQSALSKSFKADTNQELNSDNFSEYVGDYYVKEIYINKRIVKVYQILFLIGLLFLVLALLCVPAMIKANIIRRANNADNKE